MNNSQIQGFLHRYLEATGCTILERSPAHIVVKLSPQADRILTGRSYYWGFVDRTGAEPETLVFTLVLDREAYDKRDHKNNIRSSVEDVHFGSPRMQQFFAAAAMQGSYVNLFEEPERKKRHPLESTPYTPWLGVNLKVSFASDRKREEIYSYGISLATGHCEELFHEQLMEKRLTPKLPSNVHLTPAGISTRRAYALIEQTVERKLRSYDYSWAADAGIRLKAELERIKGYYEPMIEKATESVKLAQQTKPAEQVVQAEATSEESTQEPKDILADMQQQYEQRCTEAYWQFEPRVTVKAIGSGIFHLAGIE